MNNSKTQKEKVTHCTGKNICVGKLRKIKWYVGLNIHEGTKKIHNSCYRCSVLIPIYLILLLMPL